MSDADHQPHTLTEWEELKAIYGHCCLFCGRSEGELMAPMTRDHLVPIYLGGTSEIENIAPACESCNRRKGARRWQYWIRLLGDEPWTAIDALDDPEPVHYYEAYMAMIFPRVPLRLPADERRTIIERLVEGFGSSADKTYRIRHGGVRVSDPDE